MTSLLPLSPAPAAWVFLCECNVISSVFLYSESQCAYHTKTISSPFIQHKFVPSLEKSINVSQMTMY